MPYPYESPHQKGMALKEKINDIIIKNIEIVKRMKSIMESLIMTIFTLQHRWVNRNSSGASLFCQKLVLIQRTYTTL